MLPVYPEVKHNPLGDANICSRLLFWHAEVPCTKVQTQAIAVSYNQGHSRDNTGSLTH